MTYSEVINLIKTNCSGFTCIEGDIYEINFTKQTYPLINIFIESVLVNEKTIDYGVSLTYVDRLIQDKSNKIIIQSDGIIYINEIINKLNEIIEYPIQITPFTEKFADDCAGDFTKFTLKTINKLGICNEY